MVVWSRAITLLFPSSFASSLSLCSFSLSPFLPFLFLSFSSLSPLFLQPFFYLAPFPWLLPPSVLRLTLERSSDDQYEFGLASPDVQLRWGLMNPSAAPLPRQRS